MTDSATSCHSRRDILAIEINFVLKTILGCIAECRCGLYCYRPTVDAWSRSVGRSVCLSQILTEPIEMPFGLRA